MMDLPSGGSSVVVAGGGTGGNAGGAGHALRTRSSQVLVELEVVMVQLPRLPSTFHQIL